MSQPDIALQATVPVAAAGRRFDAVVAELFPAYSRSRLSTWIKSGEVLLDGNSVRPRDLVHGGESVSLNVTPDVQTRSEPEDIPLDVLFEDEHVIVIDKPAGLVVHPGAGNPDGTLVNALLYRQPDLNALPRAGIVHRLDIAFGSVAAGNLFLLGQFHPFELLIHRIGGVHHPPFVD